MQPAAFSYIDLSQSRPLISGSDRHVYQHPADPAVLIKVIDLPARVAYQRKHRFKRWYRRFQRAATHRTFIDELAEYIASAAQPSAQAPLARIVGVAQTSLGLGMLVEKIGDGHGGMAPTLGSVVREQGLTPALRARLDAFFSALAEAHVVVNDISAKNIVVGVDAQGRDGLYLVDGFGNKQAVPLFAMSRGLNARRLQRKYRELLRELAEKYQRPAAAAAQGPEAPASSPAKPH